MGKGRTISVFISLRVKLRQACKSSLQACPYLCASMFTVALLVAFSDAYKDYGYGKTADTYCSAEDEAKVAVKMAD